MTIRTVVNAYAYIVLPVLMLGIAPKVGRLFCLLLRHRTRGRVCAKVGAPKLRSWLSAWHEALTGPLRKFHWRANRTWTRGYALYHVAIVMVMLGYGFSALLLLQRTLSGIPVPDVERGVLSGSSYAPANLLAFIFGNAEPVQVKFLFGIYGPVFLAITWCEVACAVFGNCCLMVTLLGGRCGALRGDLDEPARGLRLRGRFSCQHLIVRTLIFSLIITEVIGRLGWVDGVVYYHSLLGLTILLVFPFAYLRHVLFAPLALYLAVRERRSGRVL